MSGPSPSELYTTGSTKREVAMRGDNIVQRLMDNLDLTEYEAKAYLVLVRQGPLTVSSISETGDIPRPKCYDVLKSLQSKGLVSHMMTKPIKYQALPVDIAFNNRLEQLRRDLERREREVEQLKEEITRLSSDIDRMGREFRVLLLESTQSIVRSFLLDTSRASKEILVTISREPISYGWERYLSEFGRATLKGVGFRFIAHPQSRFLDRVARVSEIVDYVRKGVVKIRSSDMIHQPFSIIDDEVCYLYLTDPIRRDFLLSIRVEDKSFTKQMREVFNLIWGVSREVDL